MRRKKKNVVYAWKKFKAMMIVWLVLNARMAMEFALTALQGLSILIYITV
jgi:hypothetical protein